MSVYPFGWPRIHFDTVPSTMPMLADLAAHGARHGTVVTAGFQSAGSGRGGRVWQAAPDSSLLLSVLIDTGRPLREIPVLSLVTALAVRETVQSFGATGVCIKWPNDVLVNDRKISGILLRSRAIGPDRTHVVTGIGLNLLPGAVDDLPGATCLSREAGETFSWTSVMDRLLDILGNMVQQFESGDAGELLDAAAGCLAWRGEVVELDHGAERVTGRIAGLRADGALELELDSGDVIAVMTGELQRGPRRADS